MYKIILKRYNRWFEEETIVEHTGNIKEQMVMLLDGKHKLKGSNDICRQLVHDPDGVPTSASGKVVEEVKYKR